MSLDSPPIPEHERKESVPQRYEKAQALALNDRLKLVMSDPECRKCMDALIRALANFGIGLADFLPLFIGDAIEASVLASKMNLPKLKWIVSLVNKELGAKVPNLDLTPDVGSAAQVGIGLASSVPEVVSGGTFSSALITACLQLKADMDKGNFNDLRRVMSILIYGVDPKPITPQVQETLNQSARVFTERKK